MPGIPTTAFLYFLLYNMLGGRERWRRFGVSLYGGRLIVICRRHWHSVNCPDSFVLGLIEHRVTGNQEILCG